MAAFYNFMVYHPGDSEAGISQYQDSIIITVDSGDPGGEPEEFIEHMAKALADWFDGAKITPRSIAIF